jgi:hypothetical protein
LNQSLVTRSAPIDFRAFLLRHFTLLKTLYKWTLRVLVPERFEKTIPVYRHTVREELVTPLRPSDADEVGWLFRHDLYSMRARRASPHSCLWTPLPQHLGADSSQGARRDADLERQAELQGHID